MCRYDEMENAFSMLESDINSEIKRYNDKADKRMAVLDKKASGRLSMYPLTRILYERHEVLHRIQEKLIKDPMFLEFNPRLWKKYNK